jgi:hypothetical protein
MNTPEIARINRGPGPEEVPCGVGTVRFIANCPGNASEVLSIAKQSLETAIRLSEMHVFEEQAWVSALPRRFIDNCVSHPTQEQIDRELASSIADRTRAQRTKKWSVRMFMNSFMPDLELKKWSWWDAAVLDENHIAIAVAVDDWPFPWESLRWLLRGSGALDVVEEPA